LVFLSLIYYLGVSGYALALDMTARDLQSAAKVKKLYNNYT